MKIRLVTLALLPLNILMIAVGTVRAETGNFQSNSYIVGGSSAAEDDFPAFALLRIYQPGADNAGRCSATLIAPDKVLTAAHCIEIPRFGTRFTVIPSYYNQSLDGPGPDEVEVIETHLHPDYISPSGYNDIAILTLRRRVTNPIAPVLIGDKSITGDVARGFGMGLTDYPTQQLPTKLQTFTTKIPSNESCNDDELSGLFFDPTLICVSPRISIALPCFGDSGGPLAVRTRGQLAVAGIASHLDDYCVPSTTFAAYTRVSEFTDFIKEHSPETRFVEAGLSPPIFPAVNLLLD